MLTLNITNYERKVQSFASKTADLIGDVKKGELSHYHLSRKAAALESMALDLERLCITSESEEFTEQDKEEFKVVSIPSLIYLNNMTALRYWKSKFGITSNEGLLEYWEKCKNE